MLIQAMKNNAEPRSYSGRGMYGSSCFAISGDQQQISEDIANIIEELANNACDFSNDNEFEKQEACIEAMKYIVAGQSQDNMGRGIVVYWPSLKWVADEDNEGE